MMWYHLTVLSRDPVASSREEGVNEEDVVLDSHVEGSGAQSMVLIPAVCPLLEIKENSAYPTDDNKEFFVCWGSDDNWGLLDWSNDDCWIMGVCEESGNDFSFWKNFFRSFDREQSGVFFLKITPFGGAKIPCDDAEDVIFSGAGEDGAFTLCGDNGTGDDMIVFFVFCQTHTSVEKSIRTQNMLEIITFSFGIVIRHLPVAFCQT